MPTSPTERKTATEKTVEKELVATNEININNEKTINTENNNKSHGKKRSITEDIRNTVIYENNVNGLSQVKIAAMVGINPKTVGNILRQQMLITGNTSISCNKGKVVDENMRKAILHERNVNGLSQTKIASIVGTSKSTVSRVVVEYILSTGKIPEQRNKKKYIDDKIRDAVIHERNVNGFNQTKIASIVGTSKSTVSRIIAEHIINTGNIPEHGNRKKPIDEEIRNTIIHEHNTNGLSQWRISAMVGVSPMTVSKILSEHTHSNGNTSKPPRKKTYIDEGMRNTIIHEYNVNGLTQMKIAAMVGASGATISRVLNDHALSNGNAFVSRSKMRVVDENKRNAILHEYNVNGLKQKDIAATVGTSLSTVFNILKTHALSNENTHINAKNGTNTEIIDEKTRSIILHEHNVNGLSQWKIATMVGLSPSTVFRILKSFKKDGTPEPLKTLGTRSTITKKDKLEFARELSHELSQNPSQSMNAIRIKMANPLAQSTFYRLMRQIKTII